MLLKIASSVNYRGPQIRVWYFGSDTLDPLNHPCIFQCAKSLLNLTCRSVILLCVGIVDQMSNSESLDFGCSKHNIIYAFSSRFQIPKERRCIVNTVLYIAELLNEFSRSYTSTTSETDRMNDILCLGARVLESRICFNSHSNLAFHFECEFFTKKKYFSKWI